MFCEIKSDKCCESLENYKVFFKSNDLKITDSKKRILHVVAEGGHLLHLLKIYRTLDGSKIKVLYAYSDCGKDTQEQMIKAFELPLYTYLVIVSPKFSESVTDELYIVLSDMLNCRQYKKVIFVAELNNILADRMKLSRNDYDVFYESLTLEDLSEDTQERLLKKKSVIFQGEDVSLEELLPEDIRDDHKRSVKSDILEKLVKGDRTAVGERLDLEEETFSYYVDRSFQRIVKKLGGKNGSVTEETILEKQIYGVDEKMILISDNAGMGKTTVLKNLAITIKKNNPRLWVIRIELNRYSNVLPNWLKNNRPINLWKFLKGKYSTKLTNDLEKLIFCLQEKVVLLLDGVDEISPDYTKLILELLRQSQKAENLAKVFVTTKIHGAQELETLLNVTSFKLVPLTEQNQIDFFTRYWTYSLKLEGERSSKCERYAKALISKVSSWIVDCEVEFVTSAFHTRMLADVFLENKGLKEWQGCKEYLHVDEVEPVLPEKVNIVKLYEMFIEKKRYILMDKGNPNGNTTANQALKEQFEECLAYHRSLALEVILNRSNCTLFSCYKRNIRDNDAIRAKVLKMGIAQKLDNQLHFVHRTFAEYFVAESAFKELQLQNRNVEFQRFLIDEVCFKMVFKVIRNFFDNFLRNHIPQLPSNIFKNYMSCVSETKSNFIHELAAEGNTQIIRLVLKCIDFKIILGREVSSEDYGFKHKNRNTINALKYLMRRGGVNIKYENVSPLIYAVLGGHSLTVKLLLEMGANVEEKTRYYNIQRIINSPLSRHSFNLCTYDSPNIHRDVGYPTLNYAVWAGRSDIVEVLLKHGVDINVAVNKGFTALHFAVQKGNLKIVECLVSHGADINTANRKGQTALHFAIEWRRLEIAKFLVEHDVNVNIANNKGYTALHFAVTYKTLRFYERPTYQNKYFNMGKSKTATNDATEHDGLAIVKFLLERGADISVVNNEGNTALHLAAISDNLKSVEFLMERDVDINIANNKGNTALHLAIISDSLKIVKFLVKHGADISIANNNGNTALHFAVKRSNKKTVEHHTIIKFLVEHNVDVNITNNEGFTALHFAADRGRFEMAKLLVEHGANINVADKGGRTALNLAVEKGWTRIADLLKQLIPR